MSQHLNYKKTYKRTLLSLFLVFCGLYSFSQSTNLVVVDSQYAQKTTLLNNLTAGESILEISSSENSWKSIREYLTANTSVTTIHLFANASYNSLQLGNTLYDKAEVALEPELSMLEGLYHGSNYQLMIYDCNLGSNEEGLNLIKEISNRTYFNVCLPTDCTSIFDDAVTFGFSSLNQPTPNTIFN